MPRKLSKIEYKIKLLYEELVRSKPYLYRIALRQELKNETCGERSQMTVAEEDVSETAFLIPDRVTPFFECHLA